MPAGLDPGGIVEGTGCDRSYARNGFERETDVRSASRAKLLVQPAAGLIGYVPVGLQGVPAQFDGIRPEHRLHPERRTRAPLAPRAMTDRDAFGITMGDVAQGTANASAFVVTRHLLGPPFALPEQLVS